MGNKSDVKPPPSTTEQGSKTTKTTGGTVTTQTGSVVAAPTSTEEEDRVSEGQRRVNLIWEHTQMKIALSVVWFSLGGATALLLSRIALGVDRVPSERAETFLYGVSFLVIGFYFGRTNHQKIGGVEQGR